MEVQGISISITGQGEIPLKSSSGFMVENMSSAVLYVGFEQNTLNIPVPEGASRPFQLPHGQTWRGKLYFKFDGQGSGLIIKSIPVPNESSTAL